MARDNRLFQEALKRGSAHAWNEEWKKAAEQYRLALREFPDDVSARTYLAMALYKSGECRESLALYQSLWNAQPSNLTMLQRVAELQEAVGDREGAAISYGRLADAHTRRRSPKDAFRAWQKVVDLTPGNPLLWGSLVEMAVQAGTVREVLPGYLALARDLAVRSRFQEAIQIVERAVSLDAANPLAISLLTGIRRAMEYWWRATGLGEVVLPEDLERLIPSFQLPERPRVVVETATVPPPRVGEMADRGPQGNDKPTITVYASSVTLSVDRSGLLSIQGETARDPDLEESAGTVSSEDLKALSSGRQLPAGKAQPPIIEHHEIVDDVRAGIEAIPQSGETEEGEDGVAAGSHAQHAQDAQADVGEAEPTQSVSDLDLTSEPVAELEETSDSDVQEDLPEADALEGLEEVPATVELEDVPAELPYPELSWEEFEALTSQPSEDGLQGFAPDPSAAETEFEPVGETEIAGVGEGAPSLGDLEPIDVPAELEELLAKAEIEQLDLVAAEQQSEPVVAETSILEEETGGDLWAEADIAAAAEPATIDVSEDEVQFPELESPLVEVPVAEQPAVADAVEDDAVVPGDGQRWQQLMLEGEAALGAGEIEKAVDLYQQSLAAGVESVQQFLGLGDAYEKLKQLDQAGGAYSRALETFPNSPQALLGLARIDLWDRKLDATESQARRALMAATPDATDVVAAAVGLLLEVLRERAAYGDASGTADGLAWLQSSTVADRLPADIVETIAAMPRELLGRSVAEHLDEIAALPKHLRGEVTSALSKAEKHIVDGKFRLAVDEMYCLVASQPDFLPAQSVLGRILVAQGRLEDAVDRAHRLLQLYDLRGRQEEALEVLIWMVRSGIGAPDERKRLLELLRSQNRGEDADALERDLATEQPDTSAEPPSASPTVESMELSALPEHEEHPVEDASMVQRTAEALEDTCPREAEAKPKRGLMGMFKALRGAIQKENGEDRPAGESTPARTDHSSSDVVAMDALLRLAEAKFASGDARGAAHEIRSAVMDERISDAATRAALIRILQIVDPSTDGQRYVLIETLAELGLPGDLAD
jgi:tetratricopeptide (TPR) repeat protein